MSKHKFTEGNWRVSPAVTNGVEGYEIHWSGDGECVTDHVYTLPDANLMAASKDLFYVCENVRADLCARMNGEDTSECSSPEETLAYLDTAIKKALGDQS